MCQLHANKQQTNNSLLLILFLELVINGLWKMKRSEEALGYFSLSMGGSHSFGNAGNQSSRSVRGIGVEGRHAINFCPTGEQALNKLLEEQLELILGVPVQQVA